MASELVLYRLPPLNALAKVSLVGPEFVVVVLLGAALLTK